MPVFTATCLVSKADGIAASLLLKVTRPGESASGENQGEEYCFNLPESLPRLASSRGASLREVSAFFVPSTSLDHMGGFPSAYLATRRNHSRRRPTFVGPDGMEGVIKGYACLSHALAQAPCMLVRPDSGSCYEDSLISVCALCMGATPIRPPSWMSNENRNEIINLLSDCEMDTTCTERKDVKRKAMEVIDLLSDEDEAMDEALPVHRKRVLVVKRPQKKKRRDEPRCEEQGHQSSTAVAPKGIFCFVVLLKETDDLLVVILLPDAEALDALEKHPLWKCVQDPIKDIKTVFHLSPPELIAKERYKRWMIGLRGKQVVVDGTVGEGAGLDVGLHRVLERGLRLRAVTKQHFPLPASFSTTPKLNGVVLSTYKETWGVSIARLLTRVVYKSKGLPVEVKESCLDRICPETEISEALRFNARLREMVTCNEKRCLNLESPWDVYMSIFLPGGYASVGPGGTCLAERLPFVLPHAETLDVQGGVHPSLISMAAFRDPSSVLFLGTGCAEPSAWRGGSAILLRVDYGRKAILLDCGEGTYGQMIRYLGEQEARQTVNLLETIWISHRHVDHSAGIAAVLSQRDPGLPRVTVFAPNSVHRMLTGMHTRCLCVHNKEIESCRQLKDSLGIVDWKSIVVDHGVEAYALRILLRNGFSLVYSGDTQPCEALVQQGSGCTLLIHESTHSCEDKRHAAKTKHTTWGDALAVGNKMSAYRTILTHFSRRYPGLPDGLTADKLGPRASVAFDGMLVRLADLVFLPSFNSAIEEVLKEIEFGGDLISSDDEDDRIIELLSDPSEDEEMIESIAQKTS